MSDAWMNKMVSKAMVVNNGEEPLDWKRADFQKIIDEAYIKGYVDGESVKKTVYIKSEHGRRFRIPRKTLTFDGFAALCGKLGVRYDCECIDFIAFDVDAYKKNGEKFEDVTGLGTKEVACQESTQFM